MAAILRRKEMAARVNAGPLDDLLASLVTEQVVYFPIRHHSPACARQLERVIRERKPNTVLIEGPASFTSLIPLILHPKTKAPFAVYTSFTAQETLAKEDAAKPENWLGPARHAAYYPFCDYSPELVALRAGAEIGATLRFVDLNYSEQVREEKAPTAQNTERRVESLLEERYLKRSRFIQKLARRTGCRDHNDLWDHLFEARLGDEVSYTQFIHDVASWCYFAREGITPAELEADGTPAREAAMAEAIRQELALGKTVVAVTGGFHTVVLPTLVNRQPTAARPAKPKQGPEVHDYLIRYGFEQLDSLNGYASGMPSPYYYDQVWRTATRAKSATAYTDIAAKFLVELGQLTRKKKLGVALSPADAIAALEQSRRLATLRGHPGPTREDLLDGIRSCFVKGSMDAEGQIVLGLARHAMGGTSIGEVPAEAGTPPLVADFRALAAKLRLNIDDSVSRKSSLDLYRKTAHRQSSRFLHSLTYLAVPFATLVAGPDFVKGTGLERLFEHWNYQWTPQTESQLVEASIYGATVEEATANRLALAIAGLENTGRGRCASEAVGMLVQACRMGLHRHTRRLLELARAHINEDPSLTSLTAALNQLVLLWESREPLEAHRLAEIPLLIRTAYERACYLLHNLADTPAEGAADILRSLINLRDLLHSAAAVGEALDISLFFEPLSKVFQQPQCPARLTGGIAGLLHGEGRLTETELIKFLTGSLNAASESAGDQTEFLTGLLEACRELAWRQPALVEAVEKLLTNWSEDEFIQRIPHLRMAFAGLTPKETDQVAAVVSGLHGGEKIGSLYRPDIDESEMLMAARMSALVRKTLEEDGLHAWLSETPALPEEKEAS